MPITHRYEVPIICGVWRGMRGGSTLVDMLELLAVRRAEPADDDRDEHQWNAREQREKSHFGEEEKRYDVLVVYANEKTTRY